MHEIPFHLVNIQDDFWSPRLALNANFALFHQWQQLEMSGCIQNFRLVADHHTPGFRRGWFFADSDAYKWLEAAVIAYAQHYNPDLLVLINEFILIIQAAQAPDGYLYTYNQLIFPHSRWENLQIEHELYCHGHLIEAAVSHFLVTAEDPLLAVAIKAADLLVRTFQGKGSLSTPGHEEIEIALLRLYAVTHNNDYLHLAQQFLFQRGTHPPLTFSLHMLSENARVNQRTADYRQKQLHYDREHPLSPTHPKMPAPNKIPSSPSAKIRFTLSALNGKYFQQHAPLTKLIQPEGHAVRYAYLQTAATRFAHLSQDVNLVKSLEKRWQQMVTRRMAVTGGIGSLPYSEGFGRDYELNPEMMYAETCAALGCMFWNWELSLATQQALYADLFEWQLYNAALVGVGQHGDCYLYNNPLQNSGSLQRQPWFEIPCCPSNLSRTWAKLGGYLCTYQKNEIWIHQFIGAEVDIPFSVPIHLSAQSEIPWQGTYKLSIQTEQAQAFKINLRIPAWAGKFRICINQDKWNPQIPPSPDLEATAQGYDPRRAQTIGIDRTWQNGDVLSLEMEMPIQIHSVHPKVKSCPGKAALSRGPLVFCLEGIDQPGVDLMNVILDPNSLSEKFDSNLLGGIMTILARTNNGMPLKFIPYAWWANRDPSPMTVFVKFAA